jgi:hypothetical protein
VPRIPNKRKKRRQTINKFPMFGIDLIRESIASFRPWFRDISLKGRSTRSALKIFNFPRFVFPDKFMRFKSDDTTIKKS